MHDALFNLNRVEVRDIIFVKRNGRNCVNWGDDYKPRAFFFDAMVHKKNRQGAHDYTDAEKIIYSYAIAQKYINPKKEGKSNDNSKMQKVRTWNKR